MHPSPRHCSLALAVVLVLLGSSFAAGPPPRPDGKTLTAQDRKLLEKLFKDFLFDPTGAQRVQVSCEVRTVWASSAKATRVGWLVAGKAGQPARVVFADGESIPAPPAAQMTKIDFVTACREVLRQQDTGVERGERVWVGGRGTSVGADEADLAVAAWLHKLGHDDLAVRFLARARKPEGNPVTRLRGDLAWGAFAGMVHAFMVRADEEALAHGERLLKLYPEALKERTYAQAEAIVADLKRRQKAGTFGKAPEGWPRGFDDWAAAKKATFLIARLDEVEARQWGQPGGVDLGSDPVVQALIKVGDPAVPALIDAIEKDERLTRSVHFWRDFARSRTVLGVREAALTAVMSILRVRVFEPASTGDNFTARGKEKAGSTADQLRAYWKKYGGMPFEVRMMHVLQDPKSSQEALREAAFNLATLDAEGTLGTTVWSGGFRRPRRVGPNPAVARFSKPSAAEAVLAALDRDLAAHDRKKEDSLHEYTRRQIEDVYLFALTELGDRRIAGALVKRSKSATAVRLRRKWAFAAFLLGEKAPWKAFAEDFAAGKVKLPPTDEKHTRDEDQAGVVELRETISCLIAARTPEGERALYALADPKHPAHALAAARLAAYRPDSFEGRPWVRHPYCLAILRSALDDTRPTGSTFKVEDGRLKEIVKGGWGSGGIPEFLRDPKARKDSAQERACDRAAVALTSLLAGVPPYHPLLKDANRRLEALKAFLARFEGRFRPAPEPVARALRLSSWNVTFIAEIKPLDRAATEEDVKAGRAVFHLGGKGRPADEKLPALAVLKGEEKEPVEVLVVQAEVGPEGTVYGAIARDGLRVLKEKEINSLRPLVEDKKE